MSNSAGATLKQLVEDIVDLENQKIDFKEQRKAKADELKKYKLPLGDMVALAKADADKSAEKALKRQDAAGILGVEVYAGSVKPSAPKDMAQDVIDAAQAGVGVLVGFDSDIGSISEEIKDKLKEAKAAGFVPVIVKQIVALKMNPKGFDAYTEESRLVEQYWQDAT